MNSVRVRMYRQGPGGCFLLSFPRPVGPAHVLIDCGALAGTGNATARITRVAESILATTGGRLDALVVTHQHWDHVSGFLQAQPVFDRLAVGEVWRAWTEDQAEAKEWVHGRTNARVRDFKPGDAPVELPGADGLRVFVLGPPRNPKTLRKSNPNARAGETNEPADGRTAGTPPFDDWFRVTEAEAWELDFFGEHYGFEGEDDAGWRRIESDWLGVAGGSALQLDSHSNDTSLTLAFELSPSRRVLLFPGDARVGTRLSGAGGEWRVADGSGTRTVTAADLLARTVLYTVGHHGSHNVTLKEQGLELMTSRELTVMLSVDRATAEAMHGKTSFPTLYRRLHEKANGRVLDREKGLPNGPPNGTSDRDWNEFVARTEVHPDWIDYRVEA